MVASMPPSDRGLMAPLKGITSGPNGVAFESNYFNAGTTSFDPYLLRLFVEGAPAPGFQVFGQIQANDEMGLEITDWWARHNRYYSKYVKLHDYESDWVAFKKTDASKPKFAADAFSVPLNLYREDHLQRPKNLLSLFDDLEDIRRAMPLYLDMVLSGLQQLVGIDLQDRILITEDDWSVFHCPTPEGYVALHVDRPRKQGPRGLPKRQLHPKAPSKRVRP